MPKAEKTVIESVTHNLELEFRIKGVRALFLELLNLKVTIDIDGGAVRAGEAQQAGYRPAEHGQTQHEGQQGEQLRAGKLFHG